MPQKTTSHFTAVFQLTLYVISTSETVQCTSLSSHEEAWQAEQFLRTAVVDDDGAYGHNSTFVRSVYLTCDYLLVTKTRW